MDIKNYIRDINNFPSEGIVFKDITPLLQDAQALNATLLALLRLVESQKIDKVVGMESRGFFFAPMLAVHLDAGFVPVRKSGKLPYDKITQSYGLEYGSDTLEIHTDSIAKGEKILVHDDVLATGGTARAVCELIERLGGEVVQCNFIIELDVLKGRKKLQSYTVRSLIKC